MDASFFPPVKCVGSMKSTRGSVRYHSISVMEELPVIITPNCSKLLQSTFALSALAKDLGFVFPLLSHQKSQQYTHQVSCKVLLASLSVKNFSLKRRSSEVAMTNSLCDSTCCSICIVMQAFPFWSSSHLHHYHHQHFQVTIGKL